LLEMNLAGEVSMLAAQAAAQRVAAAHVESAATSKHESVSRAEPTARDLLAVLLAQRGDAALAVLWKLTCG